MENETKQTTKQIKLPAKEWKKQMWENKHKPKANKKQKEPKTTAENEWNQYMSKKRTKEMNEKGKSKK